MREYVRIDNTGSINADYTIKAIAEDGNTISGDLIEISLDSYVFESISMRGRGARWDEARVQAQADDINAAHPEARAYVVDNGNGYYYTAYHGYTEDIEAFTTSDEAENKVSELTAADPSREYVVIGGGPYTVALLRYGDKPVSGTWHKLSDVTLLADEGIVVGNSHSYKMYVRIVDTAVNADILGNSASFHLEVEAVQNNNAVDTHANFYKHANGSVVPKEIYSRWDASVQNGYEPYFGTVYKYTSPSDAGLFIYKAEDNLVFYEYVLGPDTNTETTHAIVTDEYNVGDTFTPNPSWIVISKTLKADMVSVQVQ